MSTLYERIADLCEKRGIKGYRLCKDIEIQPSILTDLKTGRKKGISTDYAVRIATYFGVTVDYLLGNEADIKEKSPVSAMADEANIDYLLGKMSLSELAELALKVATEMKERGLE